MMSRSGCPRFVRVRGSMEEFIWTKKGKIMILLYFELIEQIKKVYKKIK